MKTKMPTPYNGFGGITLAGTILFLAICATARVTVPVDSPDGQRVFIGTLVLPFLNYAAPDGARPLVILGEYNPAGPLPDTAEPLQDGTIQDVRFYGKNYDFTLYALRRVWETCPANEQVFEVIAAEHFSGANPGPGYTTLAVSNVSVEAGDVLAFAGTGPYYPQQPNDEVHASATYENSIQFTGYDDDTATPPALGEKFTIGINRDPTATYDYIADNFHNQGRTYAFGVDLKTDSNHDSTFGGLDPSTF